MRKKLYDKPSMKTVVLQQRTALLAGSNNGTEGLKDYNWNTPVEE